MANNEDSALVIRDENSLRIVIGEHSYNLSPKEIAKHDEFYWEHSAFCPCTKQYGTFHLDERSKLSYFERPAGFSNWYALHFHCDKCDIDEIICGDDF